MIPLVALVLVALIIMTAIAVDGGNARQNRREAQAAADAGALAGAKSQDTNATNPQPAGCGTDINCAAAYFAFESAGIQTNPATQLLTPRQGSPSCAQRTVNSVTEVCWVYSAGGKTVTVTAPYSFNGATPSARWVHVKACWDSPNAFGKIANISLFNTCGSATAENTGTGTPPGGAPPTVVDCSGEDNFTDNNDNPTLIQSKNPVQADTNIGAHFHAHENTSALDPNSIVFKGPLLNADGTVTPDAVIPYNNDGTHGYKLSKIPPTNASGGFLPYTGTNGRDVDIQYKTPKAPPLQQTDAVVYKASLYAADTDQDHGANNPDCGQANWQFTFDGKGISGSCGENSFIQGNPPYFPANGVATPSSPGNPSVVYANYVDESPIQSHDVTDNFTDPTTGENVGINFTFSGPGFSQVDGTGTIVPYQIPPVSKDPTGYVLVPGMPNYTSKIKWTLPDKSDPRWVNGATYTVALKAYDTDNNKPGNDCGVSSWTITITGATNGKIHLVE